MFALRPLPYAEAGYGFPESGQTVINVTNGKLIRLYVDDEPFDIRYGQLRSHERMLDFRAGTLGRTAEWVSPAGQAVRISSTRLVSLTQRAIGAISYEVEPLEGPARISVQSELLANEQLPERGGDPRVSAVLDNPLLCEYHSGDGTRVVVVHTTGQSGLRVGAAMDHLIDGSSDIKVQVESQAYTDGGVVTATALLQPGQKLRMVKYVAYGWSGSRTLPAVRDQVWGGAQRGQAERLGRPGRRPAGITSTISGTVPTWRWTGTPRSSRRSASPCSTCCRRAPAPRPGPSRPRASPGPVTTGTRSGTPRRSCCRC